MAPAAKAQASLDSVMTNPVMNESLLGELRVIADFIAKARREIGALRDVYSDLEEVNINLVWTPFWNPSMMSEDAREELGFF